MQANGLMSRDGNPHTLTGALVEFPSFSDTLQDVRTSNDTRVTIDNNAAAISALAGLNEASGSWDQCLQVGASAETVAKEIILAAHGSQTSFPLWPVALRASVRKWAPALIAGSTCPVHWIVACLPPYGHLQPCLLFWGGVVRDGVHVQGFGVLTHDKAVCDASQL